MHAEARSYVASKLSTDFLYQLTRGRFDHVVEFGGRNINGGIRDIWGGYKTWTSVDIEPGRDVDVVADCAEWQPEQPVDLVVCCEVLEHTPKWRDIVANAARCLAGRGVFIVTTASDPRPPHSAVDGGPLREGEYYGNVDPGDLHAALMAAGFDHWSVATHPRGDLYATAVKK